MNKMTAAVAIPRVEGLKLVFLSRAQRLTAKPVPYATNRTKMTMRAFTILHYFRAFCQSAT